MKPTLYSTSDEVVGIRLLEVADLPATLAWRNRDENRRWFINSNIIEWGSHIKWFESYQKKSDDFVFVIEADGELVGQCAVYGVDLDRKRAEVGRFLAAPDKAGKGYIKRGCQLLINTCWHQIGLETLFLEVLAENVRAISLYVKLGFVEVSRKGKLIVLELNRL
ncbi:MULTISPECIES: GNAT family N-acetyltransferase [unclassified Pseudomonas]|jgi:RimJ/RimL family protein N-acetyltransferase|uniref:GNAT family N-acetyltransferase n=1 Tax=unclassified Pseudomonas TaxID=196821 RepID=UPI000CD267E7|nr:MULTISPECIES: GNAT family N-acetyltransferase [unclassified Pseudomonas]POA24506.1 N-acetyltransferase [Pseudomonas sp. FW305-3-2-15-E-TSA4]POA42615.1 N-acetyltransferase [Pseudomonas sp. FW305-3-2-15-E-TSA2]